MTKQGIMNQISVLSGLMGYKVEDKLRQIIEAKLEELIKLL